MQTDRVDAENATEPKFLSGIVPWWPPAESADDSEPESDWLGWDAWVMTDDD